MTAHKLSDERIKELIDAIDFRKMVTADDLFYLIARAVEQEMLSLAPASNPVGKVLTPTEMFEARVDGRQGNVIWFNPPDPGYLYSSPEAAAQPVSSQLPLTESQHATLLACALRFEAEGNKPMAEDVRALLNPTTITVGHQDHEEYLRSLVDHCGGDHSFGNDFKGEV